MQARKKSTTVKCQQLAEEIFLSLSPLQRAEVCAVFSRTHIHIDRLGGLNANLRNALRTLAHANKPTDVALFFARHDRQARLMAQAAARTARLDEVVAPVEFGDGD